MIIKCGILADFGDAGNNFTRVLTGMSAIIYKAPNNTGVTMFGDDNEPVRLRKMVTRLSFGSPTIFSFAIFLANAFYRRRGSFGNVLWLFLDTYTHLLMRFNLIAGFYGLVISNFSREARA